MRRKAGLRSEGDWIADRFEVFAVHPGGMGVVYVTHDRLGAAGRQVVALKTLRDEWLDDHDRRARFAAECRIWVQLGSHPNIVHAHEVAEIDGKPHIVLELVTGGDLRKRIGSPTLDVVQALRYGIQFCLGMEHAIRQGLRCHRDVKPGNLLVSVDGMLKITDFGLAVIRDELFESFDAGISPQGIDLDEPVAPVPHYYSGVEGPPPDEAEKPPPAPKPEAASAQAEHPSANHSISDQDTSFTTGSNGESRSARVTQTGSLLGTLPYMAPEQFRDSKAVDSLADIYAFGIVLFEMLTHGTPFRGKTLAKYDRQHTKYAPPSVVPFIPKKYAREAGAIDEIVQRCLQKDPAHRYATPAELRLALTRVLRRVDPHAAGHP
ncbi:serine/threonine-protein kinase [Tundrisphaera sp. TA3]|uniref:serine/threonine-protein kinase n=1 Tax=Tundrisphaera sp. TA3 TaxID=3435775 RepID=UPI003EBCEBFE